MSFWLKQTPPLALLLQVNGVNIEGMRHAEVVAFIKHGGDETRLLVVDPDTDEHFKRMGVVPSVRHLKSTATSVVDDTFNFNDAPVTWSCHSRK